MCGNFSIMIPYIAVVEFEILGRIEISSFLEMLRGWCLWAFLILGLYVHQALQLIHQAVVLN